MDFGLAMAFPNPKSHRIPDARFVESQFRQAVLAEELGFDHVWVAQHPGTDQYYPAPFPLLAAIAARTSRIRLGTYIVILPLHHPLRVTEEAVTLDVISDGRFDLAVGAGNFPDDFSWYGVSRKERASRMEEGLAIIKGLWEQEEFSFEGKHWSIRPPFTLHPRPVQRQVPLWVAATVPKASERAGRFGAHLALGAAMDLSPYETALRDNGFDPAERYRSVLQFAHMADTREQAWREAAGPIVMFCEYYKRVFDRHADFELFHERPGGYFGVDPLPAPEDLDAVRQLSFLGLPFFVGTAEDVVPMVESARARGITHLAIEMQMRGMDSRVVEHSMRLFARDVMPLFRR